MFGSTAARLVSLAGVRGTALAAGLSVKALWVLDASFMLDARHVHAASSFSSLFALHYDQRPTLCWSAAELASSLQALRPTQRILRQLAAEDLPTCAAIHSSVPRGWARCTPALAALPTSRSSSPPPAPTATPSPSPIPSPPHFPHQDTPLDSCPGCPANLSLLVPPSCTNCHTLPFSHSLSSCAARRIAYAALRRPDRDFTVAATVPSAAQAVAGMFHESRAPLVLQATRKRGVGVRSRGMVGGMGGGSVWGEGGGAGASGEGLGGKRGKKWGRRRGGWSGVLGAGQWGRKRLKEWRNGELVGVEVGGWRTRKKGAVCSNWRSWSFSLWPHAPSLVFALHDSPEARLLTALAASCQGSPRPPPLLRWSCCLPLAMCRPLASLRFAQQMDHGTVRDGRERWTVRDGRLRDGREARGDVLSDSEGGVNELEDVDAQRAGLAAHRLYFHPSLTAACLPLSPVPLPPTPPPLPRIPASPHPPMSPAPPPPPVAEKSG
ncbi:unnamed protein product [Closterium sp. Naga37s-1]|nr:unnamed protein product [Closterium sp. Naga37s-1]